MTPTASSSCLRRSLAPTPLPSRRGATGEGTIPPFERNKLQFPRTPEGNLAFLRGWQGTFDGDSFDFDYHLMWDHFRDPGRGHWRACSTRISAACAPSA